MKKVKEFESSMRSGIHRIKRTVFGRIGLQRIPQGHNNGNYESPYLDPSTGDEFKEICRDIQKSGMRIKLEHAGNYTVYNAIRYIIENNIDGDIIECGVESGIKIRIILEFLMRHGVRNRRVYLYDTFAGMTAPTEYDAKSIDSFDIQEHWKKKNMPTHNNLNYVPLETVKLNMRPTGYPENMLFFVKGDVLKTLPNRNHAKVALLRLDTDFYDSSKHELEHLYDLVLKGGVVILDDYGGWEGQRKAADVFFADRKEHPFMHRTCRKERVIIK